MNRGPRLPINNMTESPGPDDFIPHSAPNGFKGAEAELSPVAIREVLKRQSRTEGMKRFIGRFEDAVEMLENGASKDAVREKHGMIVLRAALQDLGYASQ